MTPQQGLDKAIKFLELSQNDTLTPQEVKKFIDFVLVAISTAKNRFEDLSKENISKLQKALDYIEKEHSKMSDEMNDEHEEMEEM
jgi:NADPH-dependent glutamate synthase beta subunit-like oxidoreductase